MKVDAVKCPKCKDVIYSRSRHDFRPCSCGEIAIDGGFDYKKVMFKTKPPQDFLIDVNVDRKALFDDWDQDLNKYGLCRCSS